MAIYDFTFGQNSGMAPVQTPLAGTYVQQPDYHEDDRLINNDINLNQPEDVRSMVVKGFYSMDKGLKEYFSDIDVPTVDNTRKLEVRVAGGDKTFLIWKQDLKSGRIKLPVMSINRTSWRFNPDKFSPPYINMTRRFTSDSDGSRIILTYRPWPALIDYSLSLWTERKRDAEYVLYQIQTRFNPLAEFRIDDESGLRGTVTMKMNDVTNNSDIDIGAEELAKVRYDITLTMEGWLPLPEKVLPTVLGKVGSFHEMNGVFLEQINSTVSYISDFFKP
jgi:hypothetical protein